MFYHILLLIICECKDNGNFHLDATYKIIKNSFPLIVLGLTDMKRQFFPICFMFSSHETEIDFDYFIKSLADLCVSHEIEFDPKYIVIDASNATANSLKKISNCLIVTYRIHLKANVKKTKI